MRENFINSVSDKGQYQTHKESNILTIKIKLYSLLMQNIPGYSLLKRRQNGQKTNHMKNVLHY